ncbi:MAG: helix-turn-helix domain-containing protein [Methylococcales bacterium]|nr:helix-turn-helix domain-containing protein [Methylococcales bacterium]
MDAEKIQLLLSRHGKSVCEIARDLSVSHSVVSRTISNDPTSSSSRVRLHISKIVGFMPSAIFDLSPKKQLYEDFLYCQSSEKSEVSA